MPLFFCGEKCYTKRKRTGNGTARSAAVHWSKENRMSKRKIGAVALLMAVIVVVSAAVTAFTGVSHRQPEGRLQVLRPFIRCMWRH